MQSGRICNKILVVVMFCSYLNLKIFFLCLSAPSNFSDNITYLIISENNKTKLYTNGNLASQILYSTFI